MRASLLVVVILVTGILVSIQIAAKPSGDVPPANPGIADGFSALLATSQEAAGVNCTYGGTRVDAGLDDGLPLGIPRDGILQADEIDSTSYVCNGAPGTAGGSSVGGIGVYDADDTFIGPYDGDGVLLNLSGSIFRLYIDRVTANFQTTGNTLYYTSLDCTGTPYIFFSGFPPVAVVRQEIAYYPSEGPSEVEVHSWDNNEGECLATFSFTTTLAPVAGISLSSFSPPFHVKI